MTDYTFTIRVTDQATLQTAMSEQTITIDPAPSGFVLWNDADRAAVLALSGANRVVTRTASGGVGGPWGAVRSTLSRSSGRWYVEIQNLANGGTDGDAIVGLMTAPDSLDTYPGAASQSADSIGWQANATPDAKRFQGGALGAVVGYGTLAPGDYVYLAIDFDAGCAWLANSAAGSWAGGGDPSSGTAPTFTFTPGAELYIAAALYSAPQALRINGGQEPFDGEVPNGFSAYTTWNPLDKSSLIDLSQSETLATRAASGGSSNRMVRVVAGKSAGKWALPVTLTSSGAGFIDIGLATADAYLGEYLGADGYGYGFDSANGRVYHGGAGTLYGSSFGDGAKIEILYDADAGELFFTLGDTLQNGGSPAATGLSGEWFAAVSLYYGGVPQDAAKIGGGLSAWAIANGFQPWV